MTVLEKYLYNDLSFTINTGFKPVLVNNIVHRSRVGLTYLTWDINFGNVSDELKNAIEHAILREPNDLYIHGPIGPAFSVGKRVGPFGVIKYFLTYNHELEYYNTFTDRELEYTVSGTNHMLEIGVVIPIAAAEGDTPVVIKADTRLYRKLLFTGSNLKLDHKSNTIYSLRAQFTELYKPAVYSDIFVVGVADANYNSCS